MKSVVADYRTRIYAVRIEAVGGQIARFVQYPHDLPMTSGGGQANYNAGSGYEFSGVSTTAGATPSVVDLRGVILDAVGYLSLDEVASRVWDNARAYLFATTSATPIEDEEPLGLFLMGKAQLRDDKYVFELMSLIDAANQNTGFTYGPLCRWTLFDETLDGDVIPWQRSRCTGPRSNPDGPSLAAHKVTGTITHVTSRNLFRDDQRVEADDWFGAGSIRFTTGANAGLLSEEVKTYAANGTIETYQAFHYPVQVGDEYEMVPGCRKRRVEDCIAKFSNAINHGGFDRVPTQSVYTKFGTGGA
ncbi:MAG: DUF2163 domain-containing protein [Porticoccaceae bacterium]|nr:DUF2163 domain-containing protein [Porticoccaceae bacterium]